MSGQVHMSEHSCGHQRSKPGIFLRHFLPYLFILTQNLLVGLEIFSGSSHCPTSSGTILSPPPSTGTTWPTYHCAQLFDMGSRGLDSASPVCMASTFLTRPSSQPLFYLMMGQKWVLGLLSCAWLFPHLLLGSYRVSTFLFYRPLCC